MAAIQFDKASFRIKFPAFTGHPDDRLDLYWDVATGYISSDDYGLLNGKARAHALDLMTAHLVTLADMVSAGESPGIETAATVDKVSVTMTPPPVKSQFQYWLNLTGYGKELLALLQSKAVGGLYIGGIPERSAFRKAYGVF